LEWQILKTTQIPAPMTLVSEKTRLRLAALMTTDQLKLAALMTTDQMTTDQMTLAALMTTVTIG
jgi:hypothetical protein